MSNLKNIKISLFFNNYRGVKVLNYLFKKKHTGESFIKRYPEVIQIKEKLLEY